MKLACLRLHSGANTLNSTYLVFLCPFAGCLFYDIFADINKLFYYERKIIINVCTLCGGLYSGMYRLPDVYIRLYGCCNRRNLSGKEGAAMSSSAKIMFGVDAALFLLFVFMAWSGVGLHIAGHAGEDGGQMRYVHIVSGVAWGAVFILHVWQHRRWYNGYFRKIRFNGFSTILLSLLSVAAVFSGLALLPEGMWVDGMFHYKAGVLLLLFCLWHILWRVRVFFRGLCRMLFQR